MYKEITLLRIHASEYYLTTLNALKFVCITRLIIAA